MPGNLSNLLRLGSKKILQTYHSAADKQAEQWRIQSWNSTTDNNSIWSDSLRQGWLYPQNDATRDDRRNMGWWNASVSECKQGNFFSAYF